VLMQCDGLGSGWVASTDCQDEEKACIDG